MDMVKQTAGKDKLGDFAPKFADLNDNVLFGEIWSRDDKLSLRDRSIVTVTALMAKGILDDSLKFPSTGFPMIFENMALLSSEVLYPSFSSMQSFAVSLLTLFMTLHMRVFSLITVPGFMLSRKYWRSSFV